MYSIITKLHSYTNKMIIMFEVETHVCLSKVSIKYQDLVTIVVVHKAQQNIPTNKHSRKTLIQWKRDS